MDSTNVQHYLQEQQQYFHGQHHFVGSSYAPFNIPSVGYGSVSPSLQWNPSILLATSTGPPSTSNLISHLPYENEFHATSCGEPRLANTVSMTTTPYILGNDTKNYFHYPQSNNLRKLEEGDMISSFSNFGGPVHNPIITSTTENQSWVLGAPYSRGLGHQSPIEHDHALELDNHSPYDDNNMITWSTISHGFADASDALNQIGLLTPSSPTSTSAVSSAPHTRLGLSSLQAMDLFSGDNNAGFAGKSPQIYDHLAGEAVISSAIGNKIMSNKASSLINEIRGRKRANGSRSGARQKASASNHPAISRESSYLKISSPPFKVGGKEKISEKVSALHQLVCPFGKTDQASVLTETIRCIHFLQDKIHTICRQPSRNKPCAAFAMRLTTDGEEQEEPSTDNLRRGGRCLVPMSWTSCITPTLLETSSNHPFYF